MKYVWEDERIQNGWGKIGRKRILIRTVQGVIRVGKHGDKSTMPYLVYLRALAVGKSRVRAMFSAGKGGNTPWNVSISSKNHSNQLPLKPKSFSSGKAP